MSSVFIDKSSVVPELMSTSAGAKSVAPVVSLLQLATYPIASAAPRPNPKTDRDKRKFLPLIPSSTSKTHGGHASPHRNVGIKARNRKRSACSGLSLRKQALPFPSGNPEKESSQRCDVQYRGERNQPTGRAAKATAALHNRQARTTCPLS